MNGWEEWDCKNVMCAFPCLRRLFINNFPNLKECLPEKLLIANCNQLVASVPLAPFIHVLYLRSCGRLHFDYQPSTLRCLRVDGCCMEESLLEWVGHNLSQISLHTLIIWDCPNMNIPLSCCYNFLEKLDIFGSCDSLRTFPLDSFLKLKYLRLEKCLNLEMTSLEHDHSLTHLYIIECPKFVSFPITFSAPKLEYFKICDLDNLKSLPECMHNLFPSLTRLDIKNCPQLESFSDGGLPSSLKDLSLNGCSKLFTISLKRTLGINTSLKKVYFENMDVESFPDIGLLPLSLTSLSIHGCQNLKNLDYKGLCLPPLLS